MKQNHTLGGMKLLVGVLCLVIGASGALEPPHYLPNWDSLDSRPIPGWFDKAKFGVLLHWGVYSVPSFGSEKFQKNYEESNQTNHLKKYREFMKSNYPPGFSYKDLVKSFKAEFYNPAKWADLIAEAGAKYVLLNGKYHDGYAMWPSKYSPAWNVMDIGPKRDLLGEFFNAVRQRKTLRAGLYHSLLEWNHTAWRMDSAKNFSTSLFSQYKVFPEMIDLVIRYKPDIFWSDGPWGVPDGYWNGTAFLAWLYNESPVRNTVVTNNLWSRKANGQYRGGFLTFLKSPTEPVDRKWELWMTMDKQAGGFRREASLEDILTSDQIIETLVTTVSIGGNLLLVVGPSGEGVIRPLYEETLREVGAWLKINGEAIYGSTMAKFPAEMDNATNVRYTKRDGSHYAFILQKPRKNMVHLLRPVLGENATMTLLGYDGHIQWHKAATGLRVVLPEVFRCSAPLPWVLKLSDVIGENDARRKQ